MKICILTAHPNDSVSCCGGTIAKYAEQGHEVIDICATLGHALRPDLPADEVARKRGEERAKAHKILGTSEVRNLDYRDTEVEYTRGLIAEITDILREIKPEVVITYWWQNIHPDLRNFSTAVSDATIFSAFYFPSKYPPHTVKKIYEFGYLNSVNYKPEFFVDITDYIDKKVKALQEFKLIDELLRQWQGPKSKGYVDQVLSVNRSEGKLASVTYAESFREFFAVETKSRALNMLPT